MFIKKVFRFLSRFVHIFIQSLEKALIREKHFLISKIQKAKILTLIFVKLFQRI